MKNKLTIVFLALQLLLTFAPTNVKAGEPLSYVLVCCRGCNNGVSFLINGEWNSNHDYRDIEQTRDIMQNIKDAGINTIIVDITNPSQWGQFWDDWTAPTMQNIQQVCREKDMQYLILMGGALNPDIREQEDIPAEISATQFWNEKAQYIWENWASDPIYRKYGYGDDRPMVIIFTPGTMYWPIDDAAPAAHKNYLTKFYRGNTQVNNTMTEQQHLETSGWGYRKKNWNASKTIRYTSPQGGVAPPSWFKLSAEAFRTEVQWASEAEHYSIYGSYDDTCDGILWGIADTKNSTATVDGELYWNKYPNDDPFVYYDIVKEALNPGTEATPPAHLFANAGDQIVELDWANNTETQFTGTYKVYRSEQSGGPYSFISETTTSNYTDNNVENGTSYFYTVTALDDSNAETAYSNEVTVLPKAVTEYVYQFDFNTPGDVESWIANDHLGGLIQSTSANGVDGVLKSEQGVQDIDPRLIHNSELPLPDNYLLWDGLEIRLRQLDADGNPQPFDPQGTLVLFMTPIHNSPGEIIPQSFEMEFEAEGEWINAYLDISHLDQKAISTIYIDPIGNAPGIGKNFELDYIYLTGIMEKEQLAFTEMNIPGTLEFEDFDKGGKLIAYVDTDKENKGGFYRESESVDIGEINHSEYYVGWCEDEEWMEYTVNVDAFGIYNLSINYAADILAQKLIDDFEGDLSFWTATGNAFGIAPNGKYGDLSVTGLKGSGVVSSYIKAKDPGTGTLTSPEIEITGDKLSFLISGGKLDGKLCMNLIVDGQVVRTATGENHSTMRTVIWDISEYKNKMATLEIVDNYSGGWGHIDIDHIQMLGVPSDPGAENAEVHLSLNDKAEPIIIKLPSTGNEQTWDTFDVEMALPKGQNLIKLSIVNVSGSLNLDKMEFSLVQEIVPGTGNGLMRELWTGQVGGRNWFVDSICAEPDSVIDEIWEDVSPGCGISNDFWNARWTGQIEPLFTEDYTFHLTANDLAKLWINDVLVIDGWSAASSGQAVSGTVSLEANQKVDIRVDYAEKSGDGMIKLEWKSKSNPREVVPQSQLYHETLSTSVPFIETTMPFVFPNPANEQLTVKANGISISTVRIFDIFGKTHLLSNEPFDSNKTYDISNLSPGLYFIKANYGDKRYTMKFIKQ